jgi:hypothetical protein
VIQELERPESWDPLQVAEDAPPGLQQLYDRMVDQILQLTKRNSEICRLLLSTATVAYRPLHLPEIGSLCGLATPLCLVAPTPSAHGGSPLGFTLLERLSAPSPENMLNKYKAANHRGQA